MYKKSLAFKLFSLFASLNLALQPIVSLIIVNQPLVFAQEEPIEQEVVIEDQAEEKEDQEEDGSQNEEESPLPEEEITPTPTPIPDPTPPPQENNQPIDEGADDQQDPETTPTPTPVPTPTPTPQENEKDAEEEEDSNQKNLDINPSPEFEESAKLNENPPEEEPAEVVKVCLEEGAELTQSVNGDWEINEEEGFAQTLNPVQLGVTYIYPQEEKVTVTFTCLPENESLRSPLKIQKVKISDLNLPEDFNAYGEYAYDITTDMANGTFEYDVTLPKPKNTTAEVSYIEKTAEKIKNQTEPLKENELKLVEEEKTIQEGDKVKVGALNHFTIFVISETVGSTTKDPSADPDNSKYYLRYVGNPAPEGYAHYYQWAEPFYMCDPNNSEVNFSGEINVSSMAVGDVAFVGLIDKGLLEGGSSGFQSGAYAYLYRISSDHMRIGPTDGNNSGEIVQVYRDYSIPSDGIFNLIIQIYNGNIVITVDDDTPISDTYGEVKTLNNSFLYDWGEFEHGAIPGWDNWPQTNMPYSFEINGCRKISTDKITICHATDSHQNPYTVNTPNKSGTLNGHVDHTGPVWYSGIADHSWGDIIPPFIYFECPTEEEAYNSNDNSKACKKKIDGSWKYADKTEHQYPGLNWEEGRAIWENDCEIPSPPSEECGNGILEGEEECDYGDLNGQSNCSSECQWITPTCVPEVNVVTNSSFNIPSVTHPLLWNIFDNNEVPGWTSEWYEGSSSYTGTQRPEPKIEIHAGVNDWGSSYDQHVELDSDWDGPGGSLNGEPASIYLYQKIPTIIGDQYTLSWDYSPRPNHNNNQIKVEINGTEISNSNNISGGSNINWQKETYTFTATTNLTEIHFTEVGTPDSFGMFLNNVEMECLGEETPECVEEGPVWADKVGSVTTGTLYNGNEITDSIRFDPGEALGEADGNFYSLGSGGEIILNFNYYIANVPGNDLSVHEITWNRLLDIEEKAEFWVKNDHTGWIYLGEASSFSDGNGDGTRDGINYFDLSDIGLSWINSVKLVESSVGQAGNDDGFDLDAVDATQRVCEEPVVQCGDGVKNQDSEECDGEDEVVPGENFCTANCKLVPIYNGENKCPPGTVRGKNPIDSTTVSSTNLNGEVLSSLTAGGKYLFETSGTFRPTDPKWHKDPWADAGYTTLEGWPTLATQYGIKGTGSDYGAHALLADLGEGVGIVEWGNFNENHVYTKYYEPTTNQVQFLIGDRYGSWFNTSWDNQAGMNDNEGSLNLDVYECVTPVEVEICKEDDLGNRLSGWEVALASEKVDGPTPINVSDSSGTNSSDLETGKYLIKVGGTYRYGSSQMIADAGYSYRPSNIPSGCDCWLSGFDLPSGNGLMVQINNNTVNWGTLNEPLHSYTHVYDHSGGPINFSIHDDNYNDNLNNDDLLFEIYKIEDGYYGQTEENGCVSLNVIQGEYILDEVLPNDWINLEGKGSLVQVGSENNSFILKNKIDAPVTIIAHKIVCNDESHLPNWGAVKSHGNPITADTAQNFVDNSQGNCWFEEDWGFEWGPADSGYSGDDLIGSAGGKWNAFGPTNENGKTQVEINNLSSLGNRIEMREVLKEGYVPFTYATSGNNNSNNVSAEFYCHRDVMNYDNWEWINSPQYGQAYHCVAFNAPLHGSAEIYKFDDENANGTQDEGENFLSDWEIVLGEKTETTDNDGKVIFADLNPGQYDLSEILKEGWGQTNIYCLGDQEEPDNNNIEPTPSPPLEATGVLGLANTVFAQAQENNSHQITVNPGQTTTCYIGNFDLGQISGYKIYDRNDNGTKEEGEEGIEDWEICLTGDNLETQNCTKTDSNGYYEFTGLTAGTYTVTEEDRSAEGWRASNPESGTYENIEIASGSNVEADFYNAPPANIWLTKNNNTTGSVGVGQTIEYTLTITVGQRTLSEMKLRDVLPDGFVYQTGTSTIDGATVEPTTNEGKTLIWNWDEEVPGESVVVVKYTIQIEPTNKPATYTNIAHVYGYGSPTLVESSIVDSSVKIDPEYQVEGRTVGGQVLGAATEGKVLGATTLPATGANTWYSIVALILIAGGITLRVKTKKFEDN